MALADEFAFRFLLQGADDTPSTSCLFLTLGEAPVDGTAIVDLDLALFDLRFLNLELGKGRLRPKCRPNQNTE